MATEFNSKRISEAADDSMLTSAMINTSYVNNCDWRVMIADHDQVALVAIQLDANRLPVSVKCIGFVGENTYQLLANVNDPAELKNRRLSGEQFADALTTALDMRLLKLLNTPRSKDVYLFAVVQSTDSNTQVDTATEQ